jgi:hypothetical protein
VTALAALLLVMAVAHTARADVRSVVRVGVLPISLSSGRDTPMIGESIGDAVMAYNAAADAYEAAHGQRPMSTERIAADDFGIRGALLTVSPGVELGGEHAYVRFEAQFGFGDDLRAIGIGIYPLNVAMPLRRRTIVPYLSLGGVASWLDRTSTDGELGGMFSARAALGVRFGTRLTVEAGYGAYVFGALLDRDRLNTMTDYDPRGDAPPPRPETAISGGEQRGLVDISVGMTF